MEAELKEDERDWANEADRLANDPIPGIAEVISLAPDKPAQPARPGQNASKYNASAKR